MKRFITIAQGSGGKEMDDLIRGFRFPASNWKNTDNDSATYDLGDRKLAFTTDSFIADPIFFPGADLGHIAFCGTVNDLAVMGAEPIGISLSLIIEQGFSRKDLDRLIGSIRELSEKTKIPVVTGDTKVMQKGQIDKIVINTSGIGIADRILDLKVIPGESIILSGGLGEHAIALLSKRFDYTTSIISDSKPIIEEIRAIKDLIKIAKDPTRGGLASALNDICEKNKVGMKIYQETIAIKDEVRNVCDMLGIDLFELACEGRFVCVSDRPSEVIALLKGFNKDACIIGKITEGDKVILKTGLGERILAKPTGRIVPRIC